MERKHCQTLWERTEIALEMPTEYFHPGLARENADKWFDEIQTKQGKTGVDFGIFVEGEVVGHIQLHSIDWISRSAELGFGLARKSDRGKGYGTDATRVIVRYGFDYLGLHRITADVVEFNAAALRVLEKCRFRLEGRQREAFFFGGRWYDRMVYSILGHEFKELVGSVKDNSPEK
jgi:RimJ/RimL family protein N-acetyltransferase